MQKFTSKYFLVLILLILPVVTVGCSLPFGGGEDETATPNVTQAYQTVNAKLTMGVAQTPTNTIQPTATRTPEQSLTATTSITFPTNTATLIAETPSPRCNIAAPGVPIDVTIPDDTQFAPGEAFTKTWRLQNVGDCTWTTGYSLVLFSGEPMSAPSSVPLPQNVAPGNPVDVSVDMVAPMLAGVYQGYWKIKSASGEEFGIGANGNDPFWVRIQVLDLPTQTLTSTPATPTVTPTPGVQVSGTVNLLPGDTLDFDTGAVNGGTGDDVSYENVAEGVHQLKTIGTALLGVFGDSKPDFANCSAATPSATFINVEALTPGTYLCYLTGSGALGRAQVSSFTPGDAALRLEILTWSQP